MAVKLNLRERLMPILVEAVQVAGGELADRLQVDVGHECPAFHHKKGAYAGGATGHSLPGQIPFKESGKGQDSVGVENTDIGARVGVAAIEGDKLPPNHLLKHDSAVEFSEGWGERPWLSNWKERHWDAFRDCVLEVVRSKLNGKKTEA
jgi:hypothetical protein